MMRNPFFDFIKFSLGTAEWNRKLPSEDQWAYLYEQAQRQALVGILFCGVEKMRQKMDGQLPPILIQWMGETLAIEAQNKLTNQRTKEITALFKLNGFRTCVLKGQGVAQLYPNPLRRQPGDIDLWVEGTRKSILDFVMTNFKIGHVVIHHVDTEVFSDVPVEIHFIPIWHYNRWNNKRLQNYFKKCAEEQFSNRDEQLGFACPTLAFNAVYSLIHIFHHLLDEGVGLRQLVDYYYILHKLGDSDREQTLAELRKYGLKRFAGAVMYVLQEVCGLDKSKMLCLPDEKPGQYLLNEIMQTGNFGKYDERHQHRQPMMKRNWRVVKRLRHSLMYYPKEVFAIPTWKVWHWYWRKRHGYL
mgnify:CR=1 FL=1